MFDRYFSEEDDPNSYVPTPKLKLSELRDFIGFTEIVIRAWKPHFPKELRKNFLDVSDIKVFSEPLRPDQAGVYAFQAIFPC